MNFLRICATAFALILAAAGNVKAQGLLDSLTSDLNIKGLTTTMDPETGIVTVTGDVHIMYGDIEMRAGSAQYNQTTGEVVARDGVTVWRSGTIYRGDSINYNSITGEMSGHNVITGMSAGSGSMSSSVSANAGVSSSAPKSSGMVFFKAEDFHSGGKFENKIDATNIAFTSHDVQNPNYHLGARELTVYPGDKAILRDVKAYAGDVPFFYFPKLTKSLENDSGYRFSPGYQSRWGAFVLSQYATVHGDHTYARYKFDLRSKRGAGGGVDFISLRHRNNTQNFKGLKFYIVNDTGGNANMTASTRYPVSAYRYRLNFQHRIYLPGPDISTWYLDFDLNKISDIHFYEDFFFNDFRTDREPDNQISLVHTNDAYVATLMGKFKVNNFYRTTTRLPELSFDFTRRPLWHSGIFHQGTISAGFYNEVVGKQEQAELLRLQGLGAGGLATVLADPTAGASYLSLLGRPRNASLTGADITSGLGAIASRLQEPDFARFHTYHELLYPKTYMGWLNVTPRIGAGVTSYGSIDGSINGLQSFTRGILHLGLDVSFKLTRSWSDVQMPSLGINGIRHVFQPYLNYSYLDAKQNAGVPAIDRLSPTTFARSIDVPLFTAVDSLRSWNVARVGFRNLLQTKRDYIMQSGNGIGSFQETPEGGSEQTYTWAGMNTFVDVFAKDPEFDRDLSNLYNELFWRPVPWLTFNSNLQLPISSGVGSFTEVNNSLMWLPSRYTSIELGHQYIADHPFFLNSSLVYTRFYARLTENYGFNMNHIFELDDGTLEFQSYSLSRDLSSWIASIGVMARDNRSGVADFGILLSFTLKDFPQLNFDLDVDPNPTGRGGRQ